MGNKKDEYFLKLSPGGIRSAGLAAVLGWDAEIARFFFVPDIFAINSLAGNAVQWYTVMYGSQEGFPK
ncbi:hypothetical protein [Faecalispora jeddahensis]|jgi:hypothetical protein|uniref:hypothetical protein n=1 Tax=Faecalispora jeddahensis TaxID=1414721 RepID=UPI001DE91EE3|nr:hypothetical protein [Faecalispora jeddahensis]MBE6745026.1 hypothetical protein [Oscillospiraceae bacterium]